MWTIRDGLTKNFTETVCCELFLWRKPSMPVDRLKKGVLPIDSQDKITEELQGPSLGVRLIECIKRVSIVLYF